MTFQDEWNKAPNEREYRDVPEGNYTAVVEDASLDLTKEPNKVNFKLKIIAAEDLSNTDVVGMNTWANYTMNEMGIPYLKQDLATLGVDVAAIKSPENVGDCLAECLEKTVEIAVKHSPRKNDPGKVWVNTYINSLSEDGEIPF